MKKLISLLISVVVCLFFTIGCSSEDGSHDHNHDHGLLEHDHDHDHGLLHSHDVVLEGEVVSDRYIGWENWTLVKVGMTIEEVKFIMGYPYSLTLETTNLAGKRIQFFVWVYKIFPLRPLTPQVPVCRVRFIEWGGELQVGEIQVGHEILLPLPDIQDPHGNKPEE